MDFNPIVIEINHQVEELKGLQYSIHSPHPPLFYEGQNRSRFFAFERKKEVRGSFVGRSGMLKVGKPFKLAAKDVLKEIVVEFKDLVITEIERTDTGCLYFFRTYEDHRKEPQTNQDALNYLKKGDW